MTETSIAAIGFGDKDLLVLKSMLSLVAQPKGLTWRMVDDPALAQLAFLAHMPPERIAGFVAQSGDRTLLIYCCSRDEQAPSGVRVVGHCPPRANELAEILGEVAQRAEAAAAAAQNEAESAVAARAARKLFLEEHTLIGAIQAAIPKFLIDQPLAVSVPGAPNLLIDSHSGIRTVHADPSWFSGPDVWRTDPALCQIGPAKDPQLLKECRRFPPRPYQAMRFWGVMSASRGAPLEEISRAARVGLKKKLDFRMLPHLEWQPRLADTLVGKTMTPETIVAAAGRPVEEIIDFLNAAAVIGLVKTE